MSAPKPKLNFRTANVKQLLEENPARIPVSLVSLTPALVFRETDFLTPRNVKVASLISKVKQLTSFGATEGLILSCKNALLNPDRTLAEVYEASRDKDLVLRIQVKAVESFGGC